MSINGFEVKEAARIIQTGLTDLGKSIERAAETLAQGQQTPKTSPPKPNQDVLGPAISRLFAEIQALREETRKS